MRKPHLLYKVTHKDYPNMGHYIFASMKGFDEDQQRYILESILTTKGYRNASMVLTCAGKHIPESEKLANIDIVTDPSGDQTDESQLYAKETDEESDPDDPVYQPDNYDELDVYDLIDQHLQPELTTSIAAIAQAQDKPVHFLQSPKQFHHRLFKTKLEAATHPKTVTKMLGVTLKYGPMGIFKYADRLNGINAEDLEVMKKGYLDEKLFSIRDVIESEPISRKNLIQKMVWDVLYKGYKGEQNSPNKDTGLIELMKADFFADNPGAFIIMPIGAVIDKEYSIVAKLRREGFSVRAITNWQHGPYLKPDTSEETDSEEASAVSLHSCA